MSDSLTSSSKIVIRFVPTVVHPIAGVHPPNTPSRAGGYNTWVEVPSDFTYNRISEIFDVRLPWLEGCNTPKKESNQECKRKVIMVPSSDGKKEYRVVREPNGSVYCSCPGFGFHGYCKHTAWIDSPESIPQPKKQKKIFVSIPVETTTQTKSLGGKRVTKIFA